MESNLCKEIPVKAHSEKTEPKLFHLGASPSAFELRNRFGQSGKTLGKLGLKTFLRRPLFIQQILKMVKRPKL